MPGTRHSYWITVGSLAALGAGLVLGLVAHSTGNSQLRNLTLALQPLATIWLAALQLIVFPLIISVLLVSIASTDASEKPGRMGGLTLVCYFSILCLGAVFSLSAASLLAGGFHIDPQALMALQPPVTTAIGIATPAKVSAAQWLRNTISSGLPSLAPAGYILPLLAATVLLGLAMRNASLRRRDPFVKFFRGVGDATLVVVRWLFYALPVVIFLLVSALYSRTGSLIARGIGYYIVAVCGTLFAFTLLQYALAWLAGGISVLRFARSVFAAQAAAVTTRSSLASLPPLLDGALTRIRLPKAVAAFVLPLSVSTFKASQSIYAPFKLIFLAHLFGVSLRPASLFMFVIGVFLLSFAAPGVPSGGSLHTIPLLLALGIPIQGIVLFNSVEAIPDIFETLLNVTADMTVATVVARFVGRGAVAVEAEAAERYGVSEVTRAQK